MSFSRLVAHNFKQLTTPVIGATLMLCMGAAQAEDSSLVIRGKDGWLFPGWGSLTTVDTKSIDSNTAFASITQFRIAAVVATILAVGSYLAFVKLLNLQFPVWPSFITG